MTTHPSGIPHSQPLGLEALVEHAPGSIVSRVLAKNDAGNVTLFAFAAEQGLSEHSAPFDALVLCVSGSLEVTIAGEAHSLSGGEVILMPKDVPHAVRAGSDAKMLLVMLRGA